MSSLHLVYAVLGTAAVVLALISHRLRQWPISEPLVALLLGVLLGPLALGLLDVEESVRDTLLLEGSRLLLAGSVMAAALRFPVRDLRNVLRPGVVLLLVVMPWAAAATAGAAWVLGLPLGLALVVGACLCPTDPVLAASVVSGRLAERDLPSRLRQLLTLESGANDGLALALVGVALALAVPSGGPADVALRLGWEVVGSAAIGLLLGRVAGRAVSRASRHRELERGPELMFTLLLAVAVLGVARLAGTSGVLAVFLAGLMYNRSIVADERGLQDSVDEAVNRYAVLPLFLLLGAVLPWQQWIAFGPLALVFVAGVLLVRRPLIVLALAKPLTVNRRSDAIFTGWFGPIGVSALFYLAHSAHHGVADERVFAAGTLAVAASVVAFGLTGSPGRAAYARRR